MMMRMPVLLSAAAVMCLLPASTAFLVPSAELSRRSALGGTFWLSQ